MRRHLPPAGEGCATNASWLSQVPGGHPPPALVPYVYPVPERAQWHPPTPRCTLGFKVPKALLLFLSPSKPVRLAEQVNLPSPTRVFMDDLPGATKLRRNVPLQPVTTSLKGQLGLEPRFLTCLLPTAQAMSPSLTKALLAAVLRVHRPSSPALTQDSLATPARPGHLFRPTGFYVLAFVSKGTSRHLRSPLWSPRLVEPGARCWPRAVMMGFLGQAGSD